MKAKAWLAGVVLLVAVFQPPRVQAEGGAEPGAAAVGSVPGNGGPALQVRVDPRVELLSLIFRLAGNPEYNQGRVESYVADVEEHFGKFREHSAVKLARSLREKQGVGYDACMGLAILLNGVSHPELRVSLNPWPDCLDRRWTADTARNLVAAAGQFVRDTHFEEFLQAHRALYQLSESRMQALLDKEGHLEWFSQFFGERPQAQFTLVLGMLNGGGCYGPHWRDRSGKEELFCILGVWKTDSMGRPAFDASVMSTVVHEFCHSYANPIIGRHYHELQTASEALYRPVAGQMRSQAYGSAYTMMCESLVRASVVRYVQYSAGVQAAEKEIRAQQERGFQWMRELSALLGQYEASRAQFDTLESFSPRLAEFFQDYAKGSAGKLSGPGPRTQ